MDECLFSYQVGSPASFDIPSVIGCILFVEIGWNLFCHLNLAAAFLDSNGKYFFISSGMAGIFYHLQWDRWHIFCCSKWDNWDLFHHLNFAVIVLSFQISFISSGLAGIFAPKVGCSAIWLSFPVGLARIFFIISILMLSFCHFKYLNGKYFLYQVG